MSDAPLVNMGMPRLQEVHLPALAAEAVRIVVETVYSGTLEVHTLRRCNCHRILDALYRTVPSTRLTLRRLLVLTQPPRRCQRRRFSRCSTLRTSLACPLWWMPAARYRLCAPHNL